MTVTRIGAWCAIGLVVAFTAGIALMATSGVQVLIPETGKDGLDWIRDVDDASGAFFAGAWLTIVGGILGLVGLIGFYDCAPPPAPGSCSRHPGAFGLTLVTISHLLPIALAYELVPDYTSADAAARASLAHLRHLCGTRPGPELHGRRDPLGRRRADVRPSRPETAFIRRWIGWLGIVVGVFAGIGETFSPASSVIERVTFIGFVAFFVWMAAMGATLLRANEPMPHTAAAA